MYRIGNNLGFDDVPFLTLLAEKIPVPVHFGNDANVAAWGEYLTGGYREDSFIMVTIGTGIGGGIILGGNLWPGINGAAAEFGHMTIDYDGVPCNCGRRGCFEAMASSTAICSASAASCWFCAAAASSVCCAASSEANTVALAC